MAGSILRVNLPAIIIKFSNIECRLLLQRRQSLVSPMFETSLSRSNRPNRTCFTRITLSKV